MTLHTTAKLIGLNNGGRAVAIALLCIGMGTAAHAEIVDISTQLGANSFEEDLGRGITGVGRTLMLQAGAYVVTPLDVTTGGAFIAPNRFGEVDVPNEGWEWNYFVYSEGVLDTKVGFGGGIPAEDGIYQASAEAAFSLAPTFGFSLARPANVSFYWADDKFTDNIGGVSFNVALVPETGTYMLMAVGLAAVALGTTQGRKNKKLSDSAV